MKIKFTLLINCIAIVSLAQSVAINTTGNAADASAILDINSTTKGLLPPRMTEAQRTAIASPAQGLIIYCTNCGVYGEVQVYNGTVWTNIAGNTAALAPLVLPSVTIGTQIWQNSNLDVSTYRDGTIIPQVTDPNVWANLTTGAWCYYNNNATNGTTYGKLYNWYAVAGIYDSASLSTPSLRKQLAPQGWHIPSDAEWITLVNYLGGQTVAGGNMKNTTLWDSPNTGATNTSGFSGLPAGMRLYDGSFFGIGGWTNWWSTQEEGQGAVYRTVIYNITSVPRYNYYKKGGFSVRCVKD